MAKKKETTFIARKPDTSPDSTQKVINLQRLYVRDLSLEVPNAPELFTKDWQPKVDVRVNTKSRTLEKNVYEVVIQLEVNAKNEGKVAFVTEVEQAGTFYIANLSKEELAQALIVACPNILFPYAREALDNLLVRGSLPPMHLAQVNFHALYEAKLQEAERQYAKKRANGDLDDDWQPPPRDKIN